MRLLWAGSALLFAVASVFAAHAGRLSDTPVWIIAALLALHLADRR